MHNRRAPRAAVAARGQAAAEGLQAAQQQRKERGWTLLRAFRPEEKAKERRALQARKVILDTVQKAVDRK